MANLADQTTKEKFSELIAQLDSPNGLEGKKARLALISAGQEAVPVLVDTLSHPKAHMRWEAAEALCEIADPQAAPELVKLLDDKDASVRWAAVKALSNMGMAAIPVILMALAKNFKSIHLRESTHHILREINRKSALSEPVYEVYKALGELEPEMTVPWLAERALVSMGYKV